MDKRTCAIEDCLRPWYCRDWCNYHYNRWQKYGHPLGRGPERVRAPQRTCSIEGCNGPYRARGWCNGHWLKWRRFGDPMAVALGPSQVARRRRDHEEIESGVRECRVCGETKPLKAFAARKGGRNGLDATCDPCRREKNRAMHRDRMEKDPEKVRLGNRNVHLKNKYGMSAPEYDALVKAQRSKCAACGEVKLPWEPGHGAAGAHQFLVVDHDHDTGHVRGMLCTPCNLALGFAGDSIKRLEQLRTYLLKHKERLI